MRTGQQQRELLGRSRIACFVVALAITASHGDAQTAAEHASHHLPGGPATRPAAAPGMATATPESSPSGAAGESGMAGTGTSAAPSGAPDSPGTAGGGMDAMGQMMGGMMGGAMTPAGASGAAVMPSPGPTPAGMAPSRPMVASPEAGDTGAIGAPVMAPGSAGAEMPGGGMGAMMGDMMTATGAPNTPLYSSLMTLPALTPEQRA